MSPEERSAGTPRTKPGDPTDRDSLDIETGNADTTFARTVLRMPIMSGDICHAQIQDCRVSGCGAA